VYPCWLSDWFGDYPSTRYTAIFHIL